MPLISCCHSPVQVKFCIDIVSSVLSGRPSVDFPLNAFTSAPTDANTSTARICGGPVEFDLDSLECANVSWTL